MVSSGIPASFYHFPWQQLVLTALKKYSKYWPTVNKILCWQSHYRTFNTFPLSNTSDLFWHNPLLGNSLKGKHHIKNIDFWNSTTNVHFFQGSNPSVMLLFKGHVVHKVEFAVFNIMDKTYCWSKDASPKVVQILTSLLWNFCYEVFTDENSWSRKL